MHVWCAAEIPDQMRSLEPPVVPDAITAGVAGLVKDEMEVVDATFFDEFHRLGAVGFAEGHEEILQNAAHAFLLVRGHVGEGESGQVAGLAFQLNRGGVVGSLLGRKSGFPLLAVEHLIDLVRRLGLIPVGIARVIGAFVETLRGVTVEDRSAKGLARDRVAVDAAGAVTTGEDELEFPRARFAEDRDRRIAEAGLAAVVRYLIEDGLGIFLAVGLEENLAHHRILVGVEETADALLGDVPVVRDLGAERIFEIKDEGLALGIGEGIVKRLHDRLRSRGRCGAGGGRLGSDHGEAGEGGSGIKGTAEEIAAGDHGG